MYKNSYHKFIALGIIDIIPSPSTHSKKLWRFYMKNEARNDVKLLEDSEEVPKAKWSGCKFDSRL